MALWIRVMDGNGNITSTSVTPADGKAFTLAELQRMVEGYIEALPLDDGTVMWLNEEGKLNGLPYNAVADLIAHERSGIAPHDSIVGNVLIATPEETGDGEEEE